MNKIKKSKGSSSEYYSLPENCSQLQDVIEYRNMNFSIGNIFKACFRMGNKESQDTISDVDKIIWYAIREKARITNLTVQETVEEINIKFMQG